jgi:hypothetical protein
MVATVAACMQKERLAKKSDSPISTWNICTCIYGGYSGCMHEKQRLAKIKSDLPLRIWQLHISCKVQPLEPQQATSKLVLVVAVPVVDATVAMPCVAVSAL